MRNSDLLREEYTIDTPENVTFGYTVAGIGSRFVGALVDTFLIVLLLFMLNVLLGVLLSTLAGSEIPAPVAAEDEPDWVFGVVLAIYGLLNFAVIWGYYLAFELVWHGQTPGKRLAGIQVVRVDGSPAGFLETSTRNLVRIVDFLPFAYALGVIVMFFNRQSRRLGDFAAGTLVIKHHRAVELSHLDTSQTAQQPLNGPALTPEQQDALAARFPNLRALTPTDYQTIQDALVRQQKQSLAPGLLARLGVAIAAKTGAAPPSADPTSTQHFLTEVTLAYRELHR